MSDTTDQQPPPGADFPGNEPRPLAVTTTPTTFTYGAPLVNYPTTATATLVWLEFPK